VTPAGFAYMTQRLREIQPKVVVLLEGGYNLDTLADSSLAVMKTLQLNPNDDIKFDKLISQLTNSEF
jgi:histone deacetylase 6